MALEEKITCASITCPSITCASIAKNVAVHLEVKVQKQPEPLFFDKVKASLLGLSIATVLKTIEYTCEVINSSYALYERIVDPEGYKRDCERARKTMEEDERIKAELLEKRKCAEDEYAQELQKKGIVTQPEKDAFQILYDVGQSFRMIIYHAEHYTYRPIEITDGFYQESRLSPEEIVMTKESFDDILKGLLEDNVALFEGRHDSYIPGFPHPWRIVNPEFKQKTYDLLHQKIENCSGRFEFLDAVVCWRDDLGKLYVRKKHKV